MNTTPPVAGRGKPLEPARTEAEARLRAVAVRVTPARVKVLTALLDAPRALSHQDMQESFAEMDRVTLYRALDCLIEAGLTHKIAGDDRVFRYSAGSEHSERGGAAVGQGAPAQHQHGHFKCTRCAKVFCLNVDGETDLVSDMLSQSACRQSTLRQQLQAVLQDNLGPGFQSHDIELTIKGWCAECARQPQ
ncbi:Fur family transcriptional regulator [Herminiimonas sp. CN]|uniref:Fur family transcriptional regulator n=1 Tax=Herminiimonas sp. CN TaxID=1349818 RepID=UPI000473915F|nr:transcriptional repressor [Herminiimonas sp. CN]